ncbi:MAG: amidinotransferase [Chloroflexi bacterium]|nr:amidinotransferase [Chloroflexota bacterium]
MSAFGGHSMVAPLRRVIVKRPEAAFRDQARIEAEWQALNYLAPPDFGRAAGEHTRFVEMLEEGGAEVLYLPPDDRTGLDSIYTHDPALITERGVVLLRMGKPARRGEPDAMGDALRAWGVPILGQLSGDATAEGGDLVWLDGHTLLAGRTYRTNDAGVTQLRGLLSPLGVTVHEFPLPHWNGPGDVLHLMSVISLIADDLAVVYPRLMPVTLIEMLSEHGVRTVIVPDEEYATLACNVLALAPRRVMIKQGNRETVRGLRAAGCEVWEFSGEEIGFKGSGGPTCLTRPLWRG